MDGPHPNINRFGHPGGMEMMNHGFPMEHMGNPHFHNPQFNPNFMNHPNCGPNGPNGPNFGPQPFHGFNPNMHMNQNFNPNMYNNNNHHNFDEIKRHPTMDFSDLAASTAASSNSKSPKEKVILFEEFGVIWFIGIFRYYRNKFRSYVVWIYCKKQAKSYRSRCFAATRGRFSSVRNIMSNHAKHARKNVFNLNISHRVMYDELPDKPIKGNDFFFSLLMSILAMMTFIPSDNNHGEQFSGLVKYFLERNRAGFISLDNHTLYLLPPCEKTSEFHPIGNNELLGIIFDSKDSVPSKKIFYYKSMMIGMNKFGRMASEIKIRSGRRFW